MAVVGSVVGISSLTVSQRDRMFEIYSTYFDRARRAVFDADLDEKDWAAVLTDPATNQVCGFSTLRLLEEDLDGIAVRAFFSGDTIIDRAYWACMTLEKVWLRFTYLHSKTNPQYRYFWFLIVNSYRSFRYLPVYAKNYYPHPDRTIPEFERRVLDRLASKRYGDEYDPESGVIRLKHSCPLRPGVADIGDQELRDPRIAFFQKCNPDWGKGDELACLTEIAHENVSRVALRIIGNLIMD